MWKASLLGALVLVSASALAANPDLRKALKLFDNLDYMPALDALQAADARPDSTLKEKVEIQLYRGMILITLGDEAKARDAFAKAISLDRRAKAPKGASSDVTKILNELRAQAPAEPQGGVVGGVVGPAQPPPEPQPQPQVQPQPPPDQSPPQYPNQAPPPQPAPYPYAAPYYPPPTQQPPPPPQAAPYAAPPDQSGAYAPVATTSAPAPSGSSNAWSAVTGFTALGLGVVGLAVGVVFQLQTNTDVTNGNAEATGAAALNDQASASQAWTYTLVGYVAGGILAVGGVTLLIVHYAAGPSHPSEPHAGEVKLAPGGLAVSF